MRSPFADWMEKYAKEVRAAEGATFKTMARAARTPPDGHLIDYLRMIERRSWQPLANRGRRDVTVAERMLTDLRKAQRRLQPSVVKQPQLARAGALAPAVANHPNATEALDQVRAKLRADGASAAEARAIVGSLAEFAPKTLARDLRDQLLGWTGRLDKLAEQQLTIQAGAALAMAVGRFNLMVKAPPTVRRSPAAWVEFAEREIAADERLLHGALRANDAFATWGFAVNLRRHAARRLFGGSLAHAAILANARKESPDDADLGRDAVAIGRLIRGQLAALTTGHVVEWHSMWGTEGAGFKRWAAAATATTVGSGTPAPRSAAISTLARQPARSDGEDRTLSGHVAAVEITHVARKAISRATLTDGEHSIAVVIPYIKVDSGGMVPGAWAQVSGTWRATSVEAGGDPALEIHRRPIGRLAREHWSERLLSDSDQIFTPVPHGLAMEWSWEPGIDGAGNALRYGTWFAEKGS